MLHYLMKSVILFAVLAAVSAEFNVGDEEASMMSVIPSDDQEVAYLADDKKIFTDFCIQARDEIKGFMRESAHGAAASIFDILFTSINDAGTDLLSAQRGAIEEGAQLIEAAAEPAPEGVLASREQGQEILEKNVEKVSLISVMSEAVKVVVNAVIETARSQVFQRLAAVRAQLSADNLKEKLHDACTSVSLDLAKRLDTKLNASKSAIRSSINKSSAPANVLDVVNKAKYDTVGCLTTGRIAKIVKFCDVLRMAGPTVFPMLGL